MSKKIVPSNSSLLTRRDLLRFVVMLPSALIPGGGGAHGDEGVRCERPCSSGMTCVAGVCRYVSSRQRAWRQSIDLAGRRP
ncbi:MAG: hypothetical protein ACR2J8_08520, partial [Thermomicrobiales bacterium]